MLIELKTDLYNAAQQAIDYKLQDAPNYEADLPQVLFHLTDYNVGVMQNTRVEMAVFTFDAFSNYDGEAEILDIQEKITAAVSELSREKDYIMGWSLRHFRILDDNSKGPLKKHGILEYVFQLATTSEVWHK